MSILYKGFLYENSEYQSSSKEEPLVGFKMVNVEGDTAISLFDSKVKYKLIKNQIHTGNIYLGTSKKFVTDYYYTGSDEPGDPQEALLTYEYYRSDVIKGNPDERDQISGGGEIVVKAAKLIGAYNLTADTKIF